MKTKDVHDRDNIIADLLGEFSALAMMTNSGEVKRWVNDMAYILLTLESYRLGEYSFQSSEAAFARYYYFRYSCLPGMTDYGYLREKVERGTTGPSIKRIEAAVAWNDAGMYHSAAQELSASVQASKLYNATEGRDYESGTVTTL